MRIFFIASLHFFILNNGIKWKKQVNGLEMSLPHSGDQREKSNQE